MRIKLPCGAEANVSADIKPETVEALDEMMRAVQRSVMQRSIEISDGIPSGAKRVDAYESATEIVVCGTPPDEVHLPEDQRHNCDEMGCGQSHVIYRFRKEGGPGYGSDCCPKCGPGVDFQTERSTFKRCDKCSSLF